MANTLVINVFAINETHTHQDKFTKNGFGYSTPLTTPNHSRRYFWLHEALPEDRARGTLASYNTMSSITDLAANLSPHYLSKRDSNSVIIKFEPPEEGYGTTLLQNKNADFLNNREIAEFWPAFREANAHNAEQSAFTRPGVQSSRSPGMQPPRR